MFKVKSGRQTNQQCNFLFSIYFYDVTFLFVCFVLFLQIQEKSEYSNLKLRSMFELECGVYAILEETCCYQRVSLTTNFTLFISLRTMHSFKYGVGYLPIMLSEKYATGFSFIYLFLLEKNKETKKISKIRKYFTFIFQIKIIFVHFSLFFFSLYQSILRSIVIFLFDFFLREGL